MIGSTGLVCLECDARIEPLTKAELRTFRRLFPRDKVRSKYG